MFRMKEVKQQLAQAEIWQEQLQTYQQAASAVSEGLVTARIEVDQMNMSASKMDRGLTRVVDYARLTEQSQKQTKESIAQLKEHLKGVAAWEDELGQAYENQVTQAAGRQEALTRLREQSKRYTGLSKASAEMASKGEAYFVSAEQQMKGLKESMNGISNLALASAIDAGRMGESATSYVQTAEQIRQLSCIFSERIDTLVGELQEAAAAYRKQEEQLHQFISLVKENNILLGKIAEEAEQQSSESMPDDSNSRLDSIKEELEAMADMAKENRQRQQSILDEMERIGVCYIEQQDSTALVEKTITELKRLLSDTERKMQQSS